MVDELDTEENPTSDPESDCDSDLERVASEDRLGGMGKIGSETNATSGGKKLNAEDKDGGGIVTPGAVTA